MAKKVLVGVGLSETIPGFGPAGALCATKFAPGEFVEPTEGYKPSLVFKTADPHICATSTRINTKITSTYKKPKSLMLRGFFASATKIASSWIEKPAIFNPSSSAELTALKLQHRQFLI